MVAISPTPAKTRKTSRRSAGGNRCRIVSNGDPRNKTWLAFWVFNAAIGCLTTWNLWDSLDDHLALEWARNTAREAPFDDGNVSDPQEELGWWTRYLSNTARRFPARQQILSPHEDGHDWCLPISTSQDNLIVPPPNMMVNGLLYVKSHKASSSTAEGINIALAHHVGHRKFPQATNDTILCRHWNRHEFANSKHFARRKPPCILWTMVRNPRARDVSHVFHFRVGRQGLSVHNNTSVLLQALQNQLGRQTKYLMQTNRSDFMLEGNQVKRAKPSVLIKIIQILLHSYDFIGVTERMEESLAVMTLLWNIREEDVIVLNAKQSGAQSFDAGAISHRCTPLVKAILTPPLQTYLQSNDYQRSQVDFLLYYSVQRSLDLTIQELGFERIQERARRIRALQDLADKRCRSTAFFPCSSNGTYQGKISETSCYVQDAGCGYPCVDDLMRAYRKEQIPSMIPLPPA